VRLGAAGYSRALTTALAIALVVASSPRASAGKSGMTDFTLRDTKGKFIRLSAFRKKIVLMTFWSSCCANGRGQLKHLEKLYRKYKTRGFVVLGINVDGPETRANVVPTIKRYKLTFPNGLDRDSRVLKLYNPKRILPLNILIKRGRAMKTREGFRISDLPAIEKEVRDLL
jgi:peroxiredoxin